MAVRPVSWTVVIFVICCHQLFVQSQSTTPAPRCSFVGGQCQYNIQLGHSGQCDTTQPPESTTCCSSPKNDVVAVQKDVTAFQTDISLARNDINTNKENIKFARDDIIALQNDLSVLKSQVKQLQDSQQPDDGQVLELRRQVQNLETERATLQQNLNQKDMDLQYLNIELSKALTNLEKCQGVTDSTVSPVTSIPTSSGTIPTDTTSSISSSTQSHDKTSASNNLLTNPPSTTQQTRKGYPMPLYCNLDNLTECGYTNLDTGAYYTLKQVWNNSYLWSGPRHDHSTGTSLGAFYVLDVYNAHEDRNVNTKNGTLISPEFAAAPNYCVKFWYSLNGPYVKGIDVFVSVNGIRGNPVWSKSKDQRVEWLLGQVDLSGNYTRQPFKLEFVAYTDHYYYYDNDTFYGTDFEDGNIAFDDLYVYNTSCSATPKCPPNSFTNKLNNVTTCYTLHSTPMSWKDAFDTCRRHSAETALVSIESKEEQDFLDSFFQRHSILYRDAIISGFHTSGNDIDHEGNFVWTDMGYAKNMTYTNWKPGQPNDIGGSQDCLFLSDYNSKLVWGDSSCQVDRAFICEVSY